MILFFIIISIYLNACSLNISLLSQYFLTVSESYPIKSSRTLRAMLCSGKSL
uniref:Uncharacterized protein n=1 Tax=Klebsiella pneumoniae TaxID=573 RepID=A0A8B0SVC6_KLEPN|nr:hypothetical protein [Klebsiella pneumoniae]